MAKRSKRIKYRNVYRDDMLKAQSWCFDNGIKIYPLASNTGEHYIEVNNNGAITKSPNIYPQEEVYAKIWELYLHFYDTNKANLQ